MRLKVYGLTVNYERCPAFVDTEKLCFGWKLDSTEKGVFQKSYRIVIDGENGTVYDGGEIFSDHSFCVEPENLFLAHGAEYTATITVTDNYGDTANISGVFYTGLEDADMQRAKWIKPEEYVDGAAPYIKRVFSAENVKKAIIYACGLGYAAYYLNGERIEDYYLDPPFSHYEKQVYYRRFNITDKLTDGQNAFCALLGEGFYSQNRAWRHYGSVRYGVPCLKAVIVITHNSGETTEIFSDGTWFWKYSPITLNNVYGGEIYDARLYRADDLSVLVKGWEHVVEDQGPEGKPVPCGMPSVREIRRLPAKSITPLSGVKDGAFIIDIGENIAGVAEFYFPPSPAGATYVMRYVETVDETGHPDYRSAGSYANQMIQQDIYIARGDESGETYRPRLCYHGFRYIEITGIHDISNGYGTQPKAEMAVGIAISTDFVRAGEFTCSDGYMNTLFKLMDGTYRANFIGFPTDCPTRERCGWLGDALVAVEWGLLGYETVSSYRKYAADMRAAKEVYGFLPNIALGKRFSGCAASWFGSAQVVIPYYAYKYCGDERIIADNLADMKSWIEHEIVRADNYIVYRGPKDYDYGDWDPPRGNGDIRRMPTTHVNTFALFEICGMMHDLSARFDIDGDYYAAVAEKVKKAFIEKFYDRNTHDYGFWGTDGAALALGIYPDGERENLLNALIKRIKDENYEMPTAMYATKYLVKALLSENLGGEAYKFLFNEEKPSFATMINAGATSVWETLGQGTANGRDVYVLSFNHPMQTAFLCCVYTEIAGIRPLSAGFKTFEFRPCKQFLGDFSVRFCTVSGEISVAYRKSGYTLTVPSNSSCKIGKKGERVSVDGKIFADGLELGSGKYIINIL